MNKTVIDTQKTIEWAKARGILDHSTSYQQYLKTHKEVLELEAAIAVQDHEEIVDAIGDITVTLIIQAHMNGVDFVECYNKAFEVIKNRTGKILNGTFVKDDPS